MNIEEVRSYCLSKRGATEDCAFGPSMLLFRLCGKIFACLDLERPDMVVVKTTEECAVDFRAHYQGIKPAWHWNKKYWNEVYFDQDVEDLVIFHLVDTSYHLVREHLPKKTLYPSGFLPDGWYHEHYPVLDSAMNKIRSSDFDAILDPYLLLTADYQTAGRGQGKNTWESKDQQNLLFAFRFCPVKVRATDQFVLLQCISVAVAMALEKYYKPVKIKWPNDIYCNDRKICGILIEHDLCGSYLQQTRCGIGINVNQKEFESSAPNPVSLSQLLGKDVDRSALLRNFVKYFMQLYQELLVSGPAHVEQAYCQRLYRLKGWYPFSDINGAFEASLSEIAPDGCLVLMDRQGKKRKYAHKEVEYILTKKEYDPSAEEGKCENRRK